MRKIIEYLPPKMQEIIDYIEISNAIEAYYDKLCADLQQLKLNTEYLTMDEESVIKHEKELGIVPSATATLSERRYNIWLQYTTETPYTEQWLRQWLNRMAGQDNYKLDFMYNQYKFILKLTLSNEKNFEAINTLLNAVVPAHILYILTYLYNTWSEVLNIGIWENVKKYTWEEILKSEDIK